MSSSSVKTIHFQQSDARQSTFGAFPSFRFVLFLGRAPRLEDAFGVPRDEGRAVRGFRPRHRLQRSSGPTRSARGHYHPSRNFMAYYFFPVDFRFNFGDFLVKREISSSEEEGVKMPSIFDLNFRVNSLRFVFTTGSAANSILQ